MSKRIDIVEHVRASAKAKVLFLPHALRQMLRPERMISRAEVLGVIATGAIVEDYPEDCRGHSCLLLGYSEGGRPLHVVCAPKGDYLAIITAYVPEKSEWSQSFNARTTG